MSTHRPRLTAGAYAASLRDIAPSLTPAIKAALASGPLSLAALAEKAGHGQEPARAVQEPRRAGVFGGVTTS